MLIEKLRLDKCLLVEIYRHECRCGKCKECEYMFKIINLCNGRVMEQRDGYHGNWQGECFCDAKHMVDGIRGYRELGVFMTTTEEQEN